MDETHRRESRDVREDGTMGLAAWTGQSRGMASAHRHLDLEINFVLTGTMRYLVGGQIVTVPPNQLCLLWGGVPHQMIRDLTAPVEAIWVTVPLTAVLRWRLPDRLLRPLLATGFVADPAPRPADLPLLHQWLTELPRLGARRTTSDGSDAAAGIVLLEIEARLRRFAQALTTPSPATHHAERERPPESPAVAPTEGGLTAVEAMGGFISHHFQDDITIAQIAAPAHLHPNYAMTLFRRHTGMTLSQYVTVQRVAHAQRLLTSTEKSIHEIALGSGFGSVSRFYEAFRQQTGNSPRRFRLQMKASPTA